jgi:hypothetical protein
MPLRFCFIVSFLFSPLTYASQFHFQLENDVTFGEDGNYSNGMILGWESTALSYHKESPINAKNWLQLLSFPLQNSQHAWGLKVSQRMWTPDEIKIAEAQPYDRPYAGLLEIEQHSALYNSNIAQKTWLAIGVTGPASGTEKLQGSIHKLLGASEPLGWQYQIENQATIQLAYEIDYLLIRQPAPFNSQWEISTFNHNAIGNIRSDIDVGLTFRWGVNLEKSFGRLSSHFGHTGDLTTNATPQTLLFFTRLQAGYRFNDMTIDGKLPYESEVEFNAQKASAATGLSYYFSGGAVTWSFNVYNKEYLTDSKQWHGYGLLQFSWLM